MTALTQLVPCQHLYHLRARPPEICCRAERELRAEPYLLQGAIASWQGNEGFSSLRHLCLQEGEVSGAWLQGNEQGRAANDA